MSQRKRERSRERQQSPSMRELLASCAAADAVSTPPVVRGPAASDAEQAEDAPPHLPDRSPPRRDAA